MESQRVKCLTEGYLRGWLNFDYPLNSSRYREELVLQHVQEERLYSLMQHKLFIETVLRGAIAGTAKDFYKPIFDISKALIELKLPAAVADDKIDKVDKAEKADDLSEWKAFLEQVNKK